MTLHMFILFVFLDLPIAVLVGKLKAHELRTKGKSDLLGQLSELKSELSAVRY